MPRHFPKISIIGAGTVGSTLSTALHDKGYPIISIISRTGYSAIRLANAVKCKKVSTQISDVASNSDIIFITVSDDAIRQVASDLAKIKKIKFNKIFIVHCSGVHSVEVLEPLRKKNALVGSIHPVQTFPSSIKSSRLQCKLKGIFYGIEGNTEAIEKADQIVEDLGGKSIVLLKEWKPLYHVACVFASNYLSMFLNTISKLTKTLELKASWAEVFGPLMMTTMENVIQSSAAFSLTGPMVRGDFETIDMHLQALAEFAPQFLPIYTISGIEVARIAKDQGNMTQENFNEIIVKFRKFIKSNSINKITKVKH
jgi:predicted short-subunit dehydrogenase-like oxidoreductase (DUF2520 family)